LIPFVVLGLYDILEAFLDKNKINIRFLGTKYEP
jgi:hypothetical protein